MATDQGRAAKVLTRDEMASAGGVCSRCGETVLWLALHTIGVPGEDDTMTLSSVCTECVASFRKWWRDGR